jgi:hypothetical protein
MVPFISKYYCVLSCFEVKKVLNGKMQFFAGLSRYSEIFSQKQPVPPHNIGAR